MKYDLCTRENAEKIIEGELLLNEQHEINVDDSTEYAIITEGISKRFGDHQAVKKVDLKVKKGTIFGLLGPNGAGKTTTIRMILGIIEPDKGKRIILGTEKPAKVAGQLGYLPEERGLYSNMKACDVIAYMGALRGMKHAHALKKGMKMLKEHGLEAASKKRIRQLSKGMAQTVQIIGTLVHSPDLVVLDEPFSGLDALNQERLERLIKKIAEDGSTVIFSTHVIAHAERLCEKVAVIANGEIQFSGTVSEAQNILPRKVHIETGKNEGPWLDLLPEGLVPEKIHDIYKWTFVLETHQEQLIEKLLHGLVTMGAEVKSFSVEQARLHDAFMHIAKTAQNEEGNEG